MTGTQTVRLVRPVKKNRVISKFARYSDVDWTNFDEAAIALKQQLSDLYVQPTQKLLNDPYAGFTVLALTCVLIDTLSQYQNGLPKASGPVFKGWLRQNVTCAITNVNPPIVYTSPAGRVHINDCADAVYHAYRCGILHEAHPPVYCGLAGQGRAIPEQDEVFTVHREGFTEYDNGESCTTVVVDPVKLFGAVCEASEKYFGRLLSHKAEDEPLRESFRRKFLNGHGIQVGNNRKPVTD